MASYEALKKKYSLPDLKVIEKEWGPIKDDADEPLLKQIKLRMREKIEHIALMLEKVIQPDPGSLVDLYEYRCFKNSQKSELFELFKHIMVFHRQLVALELVIDEKAEAEVIKKITAEWPQVREALLPFMKQLTECWQKPGAPKGELRYLG